MRSVILLVAGVAAISACSDSRHRRMPAAENSAQRPDLTLPDTGSHTDSSLALAPISEPPVSPLEQQTPRTQNRATKTRPPARIHKRPAPVTQPPADTSTRGYAPNPVSRPAEPARDTTAADTSGSQHSDTIARTDTSARSDRAARVDTAARTDSARTEAAARPDTARPDTNARPDTVARRADSSNTRTDTVAAASAELAPLPAGSTEAERTLATGTEIHAALDDSISSRSDTVGETISAHVMENVTGPNGRTLIAAGTPVRFTVTRLSPAKSKSSQGRLALRADGVALNGQLRPVKANVKPVPHELRGRGVTGSDAAKVGVGAAGGAVLGRVVGGNTRGAVIGGVAGAAAGAVVASQTATRDVVVKPKTPIVLVLTEPLVTP
jgi:glycine zipper 2TM protein